MNFRERWEAEESKLGKFLKYVLGYCGMFGGVSLDIATNYMPIVKEYIPENVTHVLFSIGLGCYAIAKLTTANNAK